MGDVAVLGVLERQERPVGGERRQFHAAGLARHAGQTEPLGAPRELPDGSAVLGDVDREAVPVADARRHDPRRLRHALVPPDRDALEERLVPAALERLQEPTARLIARVLLPEHDAGPVEDGVPGQDADGVVGDLTRRARGRRRTCGPATRRSRSSRRRSGPEPRVPNGAATAWARGNAVPRAERRAASRAWPRSCWANATPTAHIAGSPRSAHALASRIARRTRSGEHGRSMCRTPRWASASTTAFWTAGVEPIEPDSPIPFAPSGFTSVRRLGRVRLERREVGGARHQVAW